MYVIVRCTVSVFIRRPAVSIIILYFVQTFLRHSPSDSSAVRLPVRRHSFSSLVAEPSLPCSCLLRISAIACSVFSLLSQRRVEDLNVCLFSIHERFLFSQCYVSTRQTFPFLMLKTISTQNQYFCNCALLSDEIRLPLQSSFFFFPRNRYKPKWRNQILPYFSMSTKLGAKYFCLLCCNRKKRKLKQRDK